MVHVLQILTRLENKFEHLTLTTSPDASELNTHNGTRSSLSNVSSPPFSNSKTSAHGFPTELRKSYQHLTAPHKIILWPSIYIHLVNTGVKTATDLEHVLHEGTSWFIKQEMAKHPHTLPYDVGLPYSSFNANSGHNGHSYTVSFPTLTIQKIQEYTEAYFNSFNMLLPILDRESFMNDVVTRVMRDGYGDGDTATVLALLVFALGQVAIEGVIGRPINVLNGVPSGLRGGTAERPPGLEIFNEARRRLGFVISTCNLENVQILLLQGYVLFSTSQSSLPRLPSCRVYYETNARHLVGIELQKSVRYFTKAL